MRALRARGSGIDADRCRSGVRLAGLLLALAGRGRGGGRAQIVWEVENPFRFFLDPADTRGASRDLGEPVRDRARAIPCCRPSALLAERHPDGWSAFTFAKTCWDWDAQPLRLPRAGRLPQSQEPHGPGAAGGARRRADRRLHLADRAAGAARGPRGKAVTLPCDTPVQLEVPYPGGAWISVEIGGSQVAETAARVTDLFVVGMGDSFASGEGNPDVPVRFSPERTAEYGVGSNNAPLVGLSGPHRRLEGDRRPQVHRGERALAGPGLPPLALLAPAAGRAAARRRGPAPRRDVRRRRLLGRGDDVRPLPRATRATSGCPTRRTCRRSRLSPRRSAAARARATTTCRRPTTSTARSPS